MPGMRNSPIGRKSKALLLQPFEAVSQQMLLAGMNKLIKPGICALAQARIILGVVLGRRELVNLPNENPDSTHYKTPRSVFILSKTTAWPVARTKRSDRRATHQLKSTH